MLAACAACAAYCAFSPVWKMHNAQILHCYGSDAAATAATK